jgi:hypothetical protein
MLRIAAHLPFNLELAKLEWSDCRINMGLRSSGTNFLAGANLDSGQPSVLLFSIARFFRFLPGEQRQAFVEQITEKAS